LLERQHQLPEVTGSVASGQILTHRFIEGHQADCVALMVEKIGESRAKVVA
jgi:hypothetical protein